MGALMTGATGTTGLTASAFVLTALSFSPFHQRSPYPLRRPSARPASQRPQWGVAVAMKVARSITYFFVSVVMPVTTKERSTPYFFLRYWRAFTWSVISPGITSSPQGRKVGIPFSTMASGILDGCRRHSTGDFLQSTYTSFRCLFSFNSLYKNGFSGLIWPLLPAEHPRCFAAQELPAAIASWQKTLSRMYLYFWKSPVVSTGPDSGLAVCKGLDEARASERWKIREAGVSSSCSGEESGVRTHGAFYTQRFSGPPPSSTRPPLRICPYAWPVIWSFQLWCSQYRK